MTGPEPAAGATERSTRLRVVHPRPAIDLPGAERAVTALLRALGRDPASAHLADTPRRVADAYAELLTGRPFDLTTFPNDEGYDELVLAPDHHLGPARCAPRGRPLPAGVLRPRRHRPVTGMSAARRGRHP